MGASHQVIERLRSIRRGTRKHITQIPVKKRYLLLRSGLRGRGELRDRKSEGRLLPSCSGQKLDHLLRGFAGANPSQCGCTLIKNPCAAPEIAMT